MVERSFLWQREGIQGSGALPAHKELCMLLAAFRGAAIILTLQGALLLAVS